MALAIHRPSDLGARLAAAACGGFIGIGALFGGYELLSDAEGFGLPEAWLDGTPFPDYQIPGLFLFGVIGIGGVLTALSALTHRRWWPVTTFALGSVLLAWLVIETALIGWRGDRQAMLLIVTGVPALAMMFIGGRHGALATTRGLIGR